MIRPTKARSAREFRGVLLGVLLAGLSGCDAQGHHNATPEQATAVPVTGTAVVRVYPHDAKAFTQGLEFHDGYLYESTGRNGESTLRKVELETGEVLQKADLPAQYF